MATDCKICGGVLGVDHVASERMFGFGGHFIYFECHKCGALTLQNPPADLDTFYPADKYNPYQDRSSPQRRSRLSWESWLRRQRADYYLRGSNVVGAAIARFKPIDGGLSSLRSLFRFSGNKRLFGLRIADVGCGFPDTLAALAAQGFENLVGVDPFLPDHVTAPEGVVLRREHLSSAGESEFDLIIMSHSLEHMHCAKEAFSHIRRALAIGGICKIEIPVADSRAWAEYGVRWIELDAPRHFALHTRQSISRLASQHRMEIRAYEQCGLPFEFWGSEAYTRNITFYDSAKRRYRSEQDMFSEAESQRFQIRSAAANKAGLGGRASIWLQRRG